MADVYLRPQPSPQEIADAVNLLTDGVSALTLGETAQAGRSFWYACLPVWKRQLITIAAPANRAVIMALTVDDVMTALRSRRPGLAEQIDGMGQPGRIWLLRQLEEIRGILFQ